MLRVEDIGKDIVATMMDQNYLNFLFNVRIMQTIGVIIGEETMNIDPQVLFQRLIVIKDHHKYSAELFEYV